MSRITEITKSNIESGVETLTSEDISSLTPPEASSPISFRPDGIYYDGPGGKYLVDAGAYFRTYGRKSPVVTGVQRYFRALGLDESEAKKEASIAIRDAEIDRHVEWSGNLAGHRKGMIHSCDGKPMLVLTSPTIIEPVSGPAPTISSLVSQAFPDHIQRDIFYGWLAGSYRAVKAGVHQPAPMLCLAGKPNTGKSLLSYIVKLMLGGRSANPHNAWTGSLPWNDNLCAAELLLLDDCQGSTDIRSRMNFASNFKEAVYAGDVDMKKRHCSSMSVRPVWRVMVCCNDNAESLLILPPITNDMVDKVILLRMDTIVPPVDTSHPAGRRQMQDMLEAELPQLAAYLDKFCLPEELRDSRSGILAWRHPELTLAIESTKPESRLEELIQASITCHLWNDLPRILTSSEIEGRLTDRDSPVRDQAKSLFATWTMACGTWLGRLADGGSEIVKPAEFDSHRKLRRFLVNRPSCG
jgi:hypothetical protein